MKPILTLEHLQENPVVAAHPVRGGYVMWGGRSAPREDRPSRWRLKLSDDTWIFLDGHPAYYEVGNGVNLGSGGYLSSGREKKHRILWDIAFGYVSGFPLKDIAWYVITRSIPPKKIRDRIIRWEYDSGRRNGSKAVV